MSKKKLNQSSLFTYRNIFLLVAGGLILAWVILWMLRTTHYVTFPQIEYSEGCMVYNAKLFANHLWNWSLSAQPPFTVSYYTPVFYYLLGFAGGSLLVGRIIVLTFFVIGLVFVYLIVKHVTKNSIFAIIAALFPFTSYLVVTWSLFLRVDMPAVTFELIGFYIALRWFKSGWFYLSILFFLLAFWTKQSVAAAAIAVCLYRLIQNWRYGVTYVVLLGSALVASLGIATASYGLGFLDNIFLYTRTAELLRPWREAFSYSVVAYIPIIPLIALAIAYVQRNLKNLVSIFVLVSVGLSLILITHPGGAQNYFFEPIFSISIAAGCAIPYILQLKQKRYIVYFGIPLFFLITVNSLVGYPEDDYPQRVKQAETLIADATYPILTENAGIVVDAGKIPYDEPFVFNQLSRLGYWDENILLNDLKSHKIQYVITQFKIPDTNVNQRFTPEVQAAIAEYYIPILDYSSYPVGSFIVWKAK